MSVDALIDHGNGLPLAGVDAWRFVAAYRLPGGVAATLNAVQPVFVAGPAFLLLGEKPSLWRLGWALVAVVGVGLIVLRGQLAFDQTHPPTQPAEHGHT